MLCIACVTSIFSDISLVGKFLELLDELVCVCSSGIRQFHPALAGAESWFLTIGLESMGRWLIVGGKLLSSFDLYHCKLQLFYGFPYKFQLRFSYVNMIPMGRQQ